MMEISIGLVFVLGLFVGSIIGAAYVIFRDYLD